ncbi:hypothetical protein NPIL_659341 [Nephila pilipes]|uniref:Uncharacterized protein n=1 Tax=Nephila pilipes TaxID=299642 RepID=A0A8X6IUI0_NEPPI|nr:hypothetical protein NPIL_659341 [Nephila pilipes]
MLSLPYNCSRPTLEKVLEDSFIPRHGISKCDRPNDDSRLIRCLLRHRDVSHALICMDEKMRASFLTMLFLLEENFCAPLPVCELFKRWRFFAIPPLTISPGKSAAPWLDI